MLKKVKNEYALIAGMAVLIFAAAGCGQKAMMANGGSIHHFAKWGEYNLVSKNGDLYIDKADGTKSKRLTFTPTMKEDFAFVVGNTGYVAYSVIEDIRKPKRYYIQNMDLSHKTRTKITEEKFNSYLLGNK